MPYTIVIRLETPLMSIRALTACVAVLCLNAASPAFAQAQRPDASKPGAFAKVFETTIEDFRRLPSKDTLTWLSIGATIAAAGRTKDWDVTNGFSGTRMRGTFEPGATIGGARAHGR